ncbi:hypothetical protein [Aeromonas sp. MrichA-1]|uniref:hypothetical protein n=1 Tax=Aeromonas sp. MrichA-1 TaxID=2823362 RepID=UPI001B326B1B|nr:hypothetical protein [Aeromonas sp. MrichA-1]MBP4081318.1 hypothetical protein [Aeromonas sp. MrichA-1]
MSSTVAYLTVAMYNRYISALKNSVEQLKNCMEELGGESGVMEAINDKANQANSYLDENVNWDENDVVFDYKYIDASGESEKSLDAAVWDAVLNGKELEGVLSEWMKKETPHLVM